MPSTRPAPGAAGAAAAGAPGAPLAAPAPAPAVDVPAAAPEAGLAPAAGVAAPASEQHTNTTVNDIDAGTRHPCTALRQRGWSRARWSVHQAPPTALLPQPGQHGPSTATQDGHAKQTLTSNERSLNKEEPTPARVGAGDQQRDTHSGTSTQSWKHDTRTWHSWGSGGCSGRGGHRSCRHRLHSDGGKRARQRRSEQHYRGLLQTRNWHCVEQRCHGLHASVTKHSAT